MKYHMNLQDRQITEKEEISDILRNGKYAAIALCKNNKPYIVTLSYGYDEAQNTFYLHTAHKGLKLEIISQNPYVCAMVINDLGYIEGKCSHAYRSVVIYGKMAVVEGLAEKKHGFEVLFAHLNESPDRYKQRGLKDDVGYDRAVMLRLDIKEMTGKAGR